MSDLLPVFGMYDLNVTTREDAPAASTLAVNHEMSGLTVLRHRLLRCIFRVGSARSHGDKQNHGLTQPGALTRVHDHVTWCVFGILVGVEYEDLYALADDGTSLIEAGSNQNLTGEVTGFAPPGDIHRVRNAGDSPAISLHIYGTDLDRIGSSARRFYDRPPNRQET